MPSRLRHLLFLTLVACSWVVVVAAQDAFEPDNSPANATPLNDTEPIFSFCRNDLSAFLPQTHSLRDSSDQDWFVYPDLEHAGCALQRSFVVGPTRITESFLAIVEAYTSEVLINPSVQPMTTFNNCAGGVGVDLTFSLNSYLLGDPTAGFFIKVSPCGVNYEQPYFIDVVPFSLSCVCSDVALIKGAVTELASGQPLPFEFVRTSGNIATFSSPTGDYQLTALAGDVTVSLVSPLWQAADAHLFNLQPSTTTILNIQATRKDFVFASGFELP